MHRYDSVARNIPTATHSSLESDNFNVTIAN